MYGRGPDGDSPYSISDCPEFLGLSLWSILKPGCKTMNGVKEFTHYFIVRKLLSFYLFTRVLYKTIAMPFVFMGVKRGRLLLC